VTWYQFLKYMHVVLAIVAVGANASYGVWVAWGEREPQHLRAILRGIQFLDRRVTNPAYVLLLVTGLAMVAVSPLGVATPWVMAALGLYVVAVILAIAVYAPAFGRQVRAADAPGPQSEAYRRAASVARGLWRAFMVLVLLIVLLMVAKPALWGS